MRTTLVCSLIASLLFLGVMPILAQPGQFPGRMPYTPTKLEWAALELQSNYGQTTMTHESPIMTNFTAKEDGRTVLCILQYTSDVTAAVLKINRDALTSVFESYRRSRGWNWMRLEFLEKPRAEAWPGNG